MPRVARVYVAALPKGTPDRQIGFCAQVRELGPIPVPHIFARNIENRDTLDQLLGRLSREAGVDRALILGGDRDTPACECHCSLQLIESGLREKNGLMKIAIGCYPESHPRISDEVLDEALIAKVQAARMAGLELILIGQVCFDSVPIVAYLRKIRAQGVTERIRVGVACLASRKTLVKCALICGVGASLRTLHERQSLARILLLENTPEILIRDLEDAVEAEPELNIWGIHLFTFASPTSTINWVEDFRTKEPDLS